MAQALMTKISEKLFIRKFVPLVLDNIRLVGFQIIMIQVKALMCFATVWSIEIVPDMNKDERAEKYVPESFKARPGRENQIPKLPRSGLGINMKFSPPKENASGDEI
jgi:hypothetical protein